MGNEIKIITHSAGFHADEVFAVATLLIMLGDKDVEVIRTRNPEIIKTGDYVVDVGFEYDPEKNRFDHHQEEGAGKRENGIPYAAFGLVWKKFGEGLCGSKEIADSFDARLVQPIDARDNGIDIYNVAIPGLHPYLIGDAAYAFRPLLADEGNSFDEGFRQAVETVKPIIEREIRRAQDEKRLDEIIENRYSDAEDRRIIILEDGIAGDRARGTLMKFPEPLFVVAPVIEEKTWKVSAVRSNPFSYGNRKNLPAEWAGKRDKELAEITGVQDAEFCHRTPFMCVAKSKEGAIALAKLALEA